MGNVFYRTYRPNTWDAVLAQDDIVRILTRHIVNGSAGHAYLFSGQRGVGKTSVARLFAKSLNCSTRKKGKPDPCGTCPHCQAVENGATLDIVELDAASHTGVDTVRADIIESARLAPSLGSYKIFIIDEVHMLSNAAFNALLKTLEEPPEKTVFILATTELHKVPATVQSRCQRFNFQLFGRPDLEKKIKFILDTEKMTLSDDVVSAIAREARGSGRDAESLLQQTVGADNPEDMLFVSVLSDAQSITDIAMRADASAMRGCVAKLKEEGKCVPQLLYALVDIWNDMLLAGEYAETVAGWLEKAFAAERHMRYSSAESVIPWFILGLCDDLKNGKNYQREEKTTEQNEEIPKDVVESRIRVVPGEALDKESFVTDAQKHFPTITVLLHESEFEMTNDGVRISVGRELQKIRLEKPRVSNVLNEIAIRLWGVSVSEILVDGRLSAATQEEDTVSVASLDDVQAALGDA